MRIIEYKYKLLNVKWGYWILQQFGNHTVQAVYSLLVNVHMRT